MLSYCLLYDCCGQKPACDHSTAVTWMVVQDDAVVIESCYEYVLFIFYFLFSLLIDRDLGSYLVISMKNTICPFSPHKKARDKKSWEIQHQQHNTIWTSVKNKLYLVNFALLYFLY